MTRLILRIYDFFASRRWLLFGGVAVIMALCAWSASRIRFTEDISAFLPMSQLDKDVVDAVTSSISGTIFVSARMKDADAEILDEALEIFSDRLQSMEGAGEHIEKITYQTDPDRVLEMSKWLVTNIPYLLEKDDYLKLDTLLTAEYADRQMGENKLMLLSPTGALFRDYIASDPLHLSAPILQRLTASFKNEGHDETENELILNVESAYPISESRGNALLLSFIRQAADETMAQFDGQVEFHIFGAADIAVTNSERIKKDSYLSISIALVVILLVLAFSLRSARSMVYMLVALAFGWLFALGLLGLFRSEVSLIAVGISSIVIGIALNYPLHLLLHYRTNGDIRLTLKELIPPLTIGNITTICAFLSLLLVNAPAMRDMGLFAALLLLGTILFVLLILPHGLVRVQVAEEAEKPERRRPQSPFSPRLVNRIIPPVLLLITLVFWFFGGSTTFETDMSRINYMTEGQKEDVKKYMSLAEVFSQLMPEETEQADRLALWHSFEAKHRPFFDSIPEIGIKHGFREDAFAPFFEIIDGEYETIPTQSANSLVEKMVSTLADDFSKVLWICGSIVFIFLWIMLGRLELGILAFLPLAVGWVWILGIMNIFDIHFNIVNIILATLIFGQGDDYTIFITEGLIHEYAYGKKLLREYRRSILLSAIIMFIGIGALIVAQHPAVRSLAEVTLVGMSIVVVMAFTIPYFIYRWLTTSGGVKRRTPVTLTTFLISVYTFAVLFLCSVWATIVGFCLFTIGKSTDAKKEWYHGFIHRAMRFFQAHIPLVTVRSQGMENLRDLQTRPAMIICNHQSHLDLMCIMALHPKLIILTNQWVSRSPVYGIITRYADFHTIGNDLNTGLPRLKEMVDKGYSIMVFPEGTRSDDCRVGRFHRGAFHLAKEIGLDIIPVLLHGSGHVMPKKDFMLRSGSIEVKVFPPRRFDGSALEAARAARSLYRQEYEHLADEVETAKYFENTVLLNFIYKGASVARGARAEYRRLIKEDRLKEIDLARADGEVVFREEEYGLYSLLFALVHEKTQVTAMFTDADKALMLQHCAIKPDNLKINIT